MKPLNKEEQKIALLGYDIQGAEPYQCDNGELGVATVAMNGSLKLRSISDWKSVDDKLGEYLESKFQKVFWYLPDEPNLAEDDPDLYTDIIRCVSQYIDFGNDNTAPVLASWLIGSYFPYELHKSPLLWIFGPPGSGKGNVLDEVKLLGYRGFKFTRPTPAVLYRLADWFTPTMAIDELQDLDKETLGSTWNVLKCAYDGTPIARCNNDNSDLDFFQTRAFMAFATKITVPPQDVQERSIMVGMKKATMDIPAPLEDRIHRELRTRLFALRLRLRSEPNKIAYWNQEADSASQKEYCHGEAVTKLIGRPRDMARSLLFPALMFNDPDPIFEMVLEGEYVAAQEMRDSFMATVQYSIEEAWKISAGKVWIETVKENVVNLLREKGDYDEKRELKTRAITTTVTTLNYMIERGSGNKPYISIASKKNIEAYQKNCASFSRGEHLAA